jgi:hypothetical protein
MVPLPQVRRLTVRIKIMDPKMDSGCLAPGESLYDDYDVTRPLLPSEVLGIIDQLLSLEVGSQTGHYSIRKLKL